MALISYTAYSDVRAVLGVTDNELTDDTLGLSVYEMNLRMELEDISTSLPSVFATVSAIAEADRSEDQTRFIDATRLFATYAVAKQLGSALPMFSPKEMTDGKSMMQRFGQNPYQDTLDKIDRMFNRTMDRLSTAFKVLQSGSATSSRLRTYIVVASPSSDRVTSG